MDKKELTLLLVKACSAFPNSAPNFNERPEIFALWLEMLAKTNAQTAFKNLERHIMTERFFPTIADIAKVERICGDILTIEETQAQLALMDERAKEAVPIPEEVRKKLEEIENRRKVIIE